MERGPLSVLCAAISALARERSGRGPSRSRAYWAGHDALLVILDDTTTDSERTLLGHEHGGDVLAGRRLLGDLAEPDLRRLAESATGRGVRTVHSQSSLEPPISTHVFVFEPQAREPGPHERFDDAVRGARETTDSARALLAEGEQARRHSLVQRQAREAERNREPDG